MLASAQIQYFYDPVTNDPWSKNGTVPEFVYNFQSNPTGRELFPKKEDHYEERFSLKDGQLKCSGEVGVPIAEAIAEPRTITKDSQTVRTARELGIIFGDLTPEEMAPKSPNAAKAGKTAKNKK